MMRMALLSPVLLACAACVQTAPEAGMAVSGQVRVTNAGQPFQMWDGAAARKAADAKCGPRGVRSSIYDRYDRATGEWVYPGGCA
jgi:lipopolysaccharide/colanic/teichoic acid biosynthesis glycosyltransferase